MERTVLFRIKKNVNRIYQYEKMILYLQCHAEALVGHIILCYDTEYMKVVGVA
jgi:hypothetical protein